MDIGNFRKTIDAIDQQILALLNERMELAGKIGAAKRTEGGPIYVPAREELLIQKLLDVNQGPMHEAEVRSIFREIISAGIALQKTMRIGFLGPEAGLTHEAALKNFGSSLAYEAYACIADAFKAVEQREVDFAVVPIEHSRQGTVVETLDQLGLCDLKIVSQIVLPVEHCLISKYGVHDIHCIYAQADVLRECSEWLRAHRPQAKLITVDSTQRALEHAHRESASAAVGCRIGALLAGLSIAEAGIQDDKGSKTRFFVVGNDIHGFHPDVAWKSSLYLVPANTPGALQQALASFSSRGINLLKIESRPSRQRIWDSVFFIDFLGHWEDPLVQEAIKDLEAAKVFVKKLGSYPHIKTAE